jgi:hypothetical protein
MSQHPDWNMSQERAFIENLLAQRFNFFLVLFSLVIAGSVNAKTQTHLQIILGIGLVICSLIALVLRRSQQKLDIILAELFADQSHPAAIVDNIAKRSQLGGSRRGLIGIWIPRLCCAILFIGFALSVLGCVTVPPPVP